MATAKKSTISKIGASATKTVTQKNNPAEAPKTVKAAATQPIKPVVIPAPAAKPVDASAQTQPIKSVATPAPAPAKSISQSEWRGMVEQAAYYIAEKCGFSGDPENHWAEAEKQVRTDLARKGVKVV